MVVVVQQTKLNKLFSDDRKENKKTDEKCSFTHNKMRKAVLYMIYIMLYS